MKHISDKSLSRNDGSMIRVGLFELSLADLRVIKTFVHAQYDGLERKDFFIIDDMDTELPMILQDDDSVFLGAFIDGKLVGIQALDTNEANCVALESIVGINGICGEMGWTMVDVRYVGYRISRCLIEAAESMIQPGDEERVLIATVHPENTAAAMTYLNLGYLGFSIGVHYGLCRMIFLKGTHPSVLNNEVLIKCEDISALKSCLDGAHAAVSLRSGWYHVARIEI